MMPPGCSSHSKGGAEPALRQGLGQGLGVMPPARSRQHRVSRGGAEPAVRRGLGLRVCCPLDAAAAAASTGFQGVALSQGFRAQGVRWR